MGLDEPPAAGPNTLLGRPATQYLDRAAHELSAVKDGLHRLLALAPGQRALDAGCGTGADALEMARQVGPDGEVLGVDVSEQAVREAESRAEGSGLPVTFRPGSVSALDLPTGGLDACRAERVLQHVAEPGRAVAELLRVTRPGGRVLVADPDHGMWAPDAADPELTTTLLTWWFGHIRNPWMGRRLPGLFHAAGCRDVRTVILPVVLRDLAAAEALTGLAGVVPAAEKAGVVPEGRAAAWHEDLLRRDAEGTFTMFGAIVAVVALKALP